MVRPVIAVSGPSTPIDRSIANPTTEMNSFSHLDGLPKEVMQMIGRGSLICTILAFTLQSSAASPPTVAPSSPERSSRLDVRLPPDGRILLEPGFPPAVRRTDAAALDGKTIYLLTLPGVMSPSTSGILIKNVLPHQDSVMMPIPLAADGTLAYRDCMALFQQLDPAYLFEIHDRVQGASGAGKKQAAAHDLSTGQPIDPRDFYTLLKDTVGSVEKIKPIPIPLEEQDPSTGPIRIAGSVTKPELIRRVAPLCPADTPKDAQTAIFQVVVRKDGSIGEINNLQWSAEGFAKAARAAVKQWLYKPATLSGKSVDVYLVVPVSRKDCAAH